MTLKEALIALTEGKKIRKKDWKAPHFIYLKDNCLYDENDAAHLTNIGGYHEWELYQEPKKKVTKYLWTNDSGNICRSFSIVPISAPVYHNGFLSEEKYDIRLDWSATEFEV